MAKSQTENTEHTRRASIGYTYSELKSPIAVLTGAIFTDYYSLSYFSFPTVYNVTNYHRKDRRDCVVF